MGLHLHIILLMLITMMTRKMAGKCLIFTMTRGQMLACMEETKRTFMTGSEDMPILAKSQIKVAMKQQVTAKDNEQSSKIKSIFLRSPMKKVKKFRALFKSFFLHKKHF